MRRVAGLWLLCVLVAAPVLADEFDAYIAAQRKRIDEPGLSIEDREQIALDLAATYHRAAEQAGTDDARLARWAESASMLESFGSRYPDHPRQAVFQAQAGVEHWAIGRLLKDRAEAYPAETAWRHRAIAALDESIRVLGSLDELPADLAGNRDYRLAQALFDRAELEPEDSPDRAPRLERALTLLPPDRRAAGLAGPSHLLRARVLTNLGRLEEADRAIEAAEAAGDSVPVTERVEAVVLLRIAEQRLQDARRALDRLPPGSDSARWLLTLRIALAEAGPSADSQAEAFSMVRRLLEAGGPSGRLALVRLARGLDSPSEELGADDYRLLVEANLANGDGERAARLAREGADRAEARGLGEDAARLRYQSAAILIRGGQGEEALAPLEAIARDEKAGAMRPRAALLGAVVLGDAEADRPSARYLDALDQVIARFPESNEASEARWLLGTARRTLGEVAEAEAAWLAIPPEHSRWRDARLAVASTRLATIERDLDVVGASENTSRFREAWAALDEIAAGLGDDRSARVDVDLERVRLDLLPEIGQPKRALATLDDLLAGPLDEARRTQAGVLRIHALTANGQYPEAERLARDLREGVPIGDLLRLARRLDRAAVAGESDLEARRYGAVLRLVMEAMLARPAGLASSDRAEARLRLLRAEVFRGDLASARTAFADWSGAADEVPPEAWDDLADLALRVGDAARAIEVETRITRRSRPGSNEWLSARHGQALGLSRLGRTAEAKQVLEATAVLHPKLGGEALRKRFEALRSRLDAR